MRLTTKEAKALGLHMEPPRKAPERPRKSRETKTGPSPSDALFLAACEAHGLPVPIPEYPFAKEIGREWRFDWLFGGLYALEIEGGAWTNGRHVTGKGFLNDMEKYNEAQIMGFLVLRCTPDMVESGEVFDLLKRAMKSGE
jgi:hypothetical protein